MNEWTREPDSSLQEQGGMSRLLRLNHTWYLYICRYLYVSHLHDSRGWDEGYWELEGVLEWSKLFFMGISPCAE
jgi:hypothetical protein